jgi:hypothetical protein
MTLMSSANNIGYDTEFILRGKSFIHLLTTEALELILRELHVSMYPSQRKNFQFFYVNLLQLAISY